MWARSSLALLLLPALGAAPPQTKEPTPPRGPVSVYDQACIRCHGPEGSFYGPTFGKGLTDAALRRVVVEMKDGKGDIALDDAQIDAQVAYHRAMIRREPFVAVVRATPTLLQGECTENAVITVLADGKPVPVKRNGYRWEAVAKGARREVVATVGKVVVRLDPDREPHSHRTPLPDPGK